MPVSFSKGLGGLQLAISDRRLRLRTAIKALFVGASWKRCRVHFIRNMASRVLKASEP